MTAPTASTRGAIYVCMGLHYVLMAMVSIKTLKKFNPHLAVTIVTNVDLPMHRFAFWSADVDRVVLVNQLDSQNRFIKSNIYEFSPYEQTLYIDADTYVAGCLDDLFAFLKYFDVALKLNPVQQTKLGKGDQKVLDGAFSVKDLPHWNSGVIAFNKSQASSEFFKYWASAFAATNLPYDQIALVDAIFKTPTRVLSLNDVWNKFPSAKLYVNGLAEAKIVHYTNRISFELEGQLANMAKLAQADVQDLKRFVANKRKQRFKKVGLLRSCALVFLWVFARRHEKAVFAEVS